MKKPAIERLMEHSEWDGECLVWVRARTAKGYGRISVGHRAWKTHQLAYTLEYGPIPKGMFVLHSCDNPPCFNIDHLRLGTRQDNADDVGLHGRTELLRRRGNANGMTSLTPDQVISIRDDPRTLRVIAEEYGITPSSVSLLKKRRRWAHI